MKYELAKELKEAGYPQMGGDGLTLWKSEGLSNNQADERAYAPTLSELIEACGNECFMLTYRAYGKWNAKRAKQDENTNINWFDAEGDTPEEAVARLYIALNKKL